MSTLREAAQQALEALEFMADEWGFTQKANRPERWQAIDALRAALVQDEPKGGGNLPPPLQAEPVAYTGDVARRMREAGMTFHLGMPHAIVMEQMTRFHDIVCAEVSIKAAVAFAHPPHREWKGLSEEDMEDLLPLYSDPSVNTEMLEFAAAIEAKLKEKNNG